MNGVSYYLMQQGRTADDLARLTGLPEQAVRAMMEEKEPQLPSCYYMHVAAALGVWEDALLVDYPDAANQRDVGTMCTHWEERFERKPDAFCKIYVAKITKSHELYRYRREFCHLEYEYLQHCIYCSADLEDGVYEVRARWYENYTCRKELSWKRSWFAIFGGVKYELDESDVLFTAFNIEAQHGRLAA